MRVFSLNQKTEFKYPEIEVDFHWWNQNSTSFHTHNYYEFFIITKGEMLHKINNAETIVSKGTLYFVKPSDKHMFSPINNTESQHINLKVTSDKLKSLCDIFQPLFYEHIKHENFQQVIKLTELEFEYFINLAEQLTFSNVNTSDNIAVITTQMIINALSILMRKPSEQSNLPVWLEQLLTKINSPEFLCNKVSEIYKLSNYSQPMLLHYFQKHLGMTVISYFTNVKINYACNLLKNTNFTILDISSRLGFDSLSHFNKIFKKHTGKSPSEYRKQKV